MDSFISQLLWQFPGSDRVARNRAGFGRSLQKCPPNKGWGETHKRCPHGCTRRNACFPLCSQDRGFRRPEVSMNTKTVRRPDQRRPGRSKKYVKQTAHVEARRDGKPLIFGWGGHLSRSEKLRIQQRVIWGFAALAVLSII